MYKKIINNPLIQYVLTRYFTYFIQFLNSLIIAVKLGPFYLGIWGFINLVIQYFNQINFGIPYSVNAILAINKDKTAYVKTVFNNAIILVAFSGSLIFIFYLCNEVFNLQIGKKYDFDRYFVVVCFIGFLNYFMSLFSNVFRIYGRLFEIAFSQSILPILILICLCLFKGESLLTALIFANLLAFGLSVLLYIKNSPLRFRFRFSSSISKDIIQKGFFLFIYNASFYLIVISTRTLISSNYNISDFGIFTFAFSLGNVIVLLLESFAFLIFPKVLNKLHTSTLQEGRIFLDKIRVAYTTISHLIVHIAIFVFPFFLYFFPKYNSSLLSFRLIALTLVLFTNAFGYQGLLIAKGKERQLSLIALLALIFNLVFGLILIHLMDLNYQFIILATTATYFIYSTVVSYSGNKILGANLNLAKCLLKIMPLKLLLPFIVSLFLTLIQVVSPYYFLLSLFLFILMNVNEYSLIKSNMRNILNNPKITDI